MAVLIDEDTRLLVQGITGHQGTFHTEAMQAFGTEVVAGVTPGKGGQEVHGVPVFDAVEEAVEATNANASMVVVPARFTRDACVEAIEAGLDTLVVITEGMPFHDALHVHHRARRANTTVVGPNCPGVCSPGAKAKVGIQPNTIWADGGVAVASRSGTLTYEIVAALTEAGMGQSTCIGLGGDPITGMNFIDALERFEADDATEAIVLVGEIGGTAEEEAAGYVEANVSTPCAAYIAGRSAPAGKRMGHAGAIVTRGMGTAASKVKAFEAAGVPVADFPTDLPGMIA